MPQAIYDPKLNNLADEIRKLERSSLLPAIVTIGGNLQQAFECLDDDSNFGDWLRHEFDDWSPRSAANYRNAFKFAAALEAGDYGTPHKLSELNIAATAIYVMMERAGDDLEIIKKVVQIALRSRVGKRVVEDILEPAPPIQPEAEADAEVIDDEADSDEDDPAKTAPPSHSRPNGPRAALLRALRFGGHDGWRRSVEQFSGSEELRSLMDRIGQLLRIYHEVCAGDEIKAKADAAAARSKLH